MVLLFPNYLFSSEVNHLIFKWKKIVKFIAEITNPIATSNIENSASLCSVVLNPDNKHTTTLFEKDYSNQEGMIKSSLIYISSVLWRKIYLFYCIFRKVKLRAQKKEWNRFLSKPKVGDRIQNLSLMRYRIECFMHLKYPKTDIKIKYNTPIIFNRFLILIF